jgi:hypothetical protein
MRDCLRAVGAVGSFITTEAHFAEWMSARYLW